MSSDFVHSTKSALPELVEYLKVAEGHLGTLRLLDGVEVGSSARGPGVGRSPFVRRSSAGLGAALALLADDRCRSIGVCALSLCSASAQTDPRLVRRMLASYGVRASGSSGLQAYA